jgi:hypothetical protein
MAGSVPARQTLSPIKNGPATMGLNISTGQTRRVQTAPHRLREAFQ